MNLHTWWLFVATVFVISAIPGPNMLVVMTHSARHTLRRATATMAGCLSALVLMLSISAAGLGVFLKAWPTMFDALRLIGAAYLIYLGVKSWRANVAEPAPASGEPQHDASAKPARTLGALYRNGFLVASSNPKAILFAAALLPQFIDASKATLPQFGVLVATFAVIEVSWYLVYAPLRRAHRLNAQKRARRTRVQSADGRRVRRLRRHDGARAALSGLHQVKAAAAIAANMASVRAVRSPLAPALVVRARHKPEQERRPGED